TTWLIEPHMVIESSPARWHVYFLIEPTTDLAAWSDCQVRCATYYNGDKKIHDRPRVLRLPGFDNLKREKPFRVHLVKCDAEAPTRTRSSTMRRAAPPSARWPRWTSS